MAFSSQQFDFRGNGDDVSVAEIDALLHSLQQGSIYFRGQVSEQKRYFILENRQVIASHRREWEAWFRCNSSTIASTLIAEVEVRTVYLGVDHDFGERVQPLLFETIVLGGELDQSRQRYASWAECLDGHRRWVSAVRQFPKVEQ